MVPHTVLFLQNAWSSTGFSSYDEWLRALRASRTGVRLSNMIREEEWGQIVFANSSPIVGNHPDSIFGAQAQHISRVLRRHRPQVVIACGRVAGRALPALWNGPLLLLPHPAYRVVSNALFRKARRLWLGEWTNQVVELKQGRGKTLVL